MAQVKAQVLLEIKAKFDELIGAIRESKNAENSFASLANKGAAMALGFGGVQSAVAGIRSAFRSVIVDGVNFNATLQDAQTSIAGVIRQFDGAKVSSFSEAMRLSTKIIADLKKEALETKSTFEELVTGYQGSAGAMYAAGVPLNKQVTLISSISQGMAALGIRTEEMRQEATALLMGNIDRNARLAQTLGITRAQIENAKEQGELYEFLMGKLANFRESAIEAAKANTSFLESNLKDAYIQQAAAATESLTGAYNGLLKTITDIVRSSEFKELISTLAEIPVIAADGVSILAGNRFRQKASDDSALKAIEERIKDATTENDLYKAQLEIKKEIAKLEKEQANQAKLTTTQSDAADRLRRAPTIGNLYQLNNTGVSPFGAQEVSARSVVIDRVIEKFKEAENKIAQNGKDIIKKNLADAEEAKAKAKAKNEAERIENEREKAVKSLTDAQEKLRDAELKSMSLADRRVGLQKDLNAELVKPLKTAEDYLTEAEKQNLTEADRVEAQKAADSANATHNTRILQLRQEIARVDADIVSLREKDFDLLMREERDAAKRLADINVSSAENAMRVYEEKRKRIEQDANLTSRERREKMRAALQEENAAIEKTVAALGRAKAQTKDDAARKLYDNNIGALRSRQSENRVAIDTSYAPLTFGAELREQMTMLREGFTSVAQAISGVIGSAISGVSNAIVGLINGTMTWKDAFLSVGVAISQSVIQAFADMAAQWLVKQVIMDNISRVFRLKRGAEEAATSAAIVGIATSEEAAKTAAAATGAAARTTIATGEAAAVGTATGIAGVFRSIMELGPIAGPVVFATAIGGMIALVMSLMKGFRRGGWTGYGADDEVAGVAHRNEMVFNSGDVRRFGGPATLDRIRMAGPSALAARPVAVPVQSPASSGSFGGRSDQQISVAILDRRSRLDDAMRSRRGKAVFVETANEMGLAFA